MKIDFTRKFTNFDGKTLTDEATKQELSLGDVCISALLASDKSDVLDGKEKIVRYNLASEIHKGKESLTAEEVVLLKDLIGKYFTTIIVGQALPLLDSE